MLKIVTNLPGGFIIMKIVKKLVIITICILAVLIGGISFLIYAYPVGVADYQFDKIQAAYGLTEVGFKWGIGGADSMLMPPKAREEYITRGGCSIVVGVDNQNRKLQIYFDQTFGINPAAHSFAIRLPNEWDIGQYLNYNNVSEGFVVDDTTPIILPAQQLD